MTREQMLDLFNKHQHAIEQRDSQALAALYSETATLESPLAGMISGRQAIARFHDTFFDAFPDVVMATEPPLVEGNRAVGISTLSGTQRGTFMNLPASGKPFRVSLAFLLDVQDDLITHERRIYDFTGLLLQLGVLKAKPA